MALAVEAEAEAEAEAEEGVLLGDETWLPPPFLLGEALNTGRGMRLSLPAHGQRSFHNTVAKKKCCSANIKLTRLVDVHPASASPCLFPQRRPGSAAVGAAVGAGLGGCVVPGGGGLGPGDGRGGGGDGGPASRGRGGGRLQLADVSELEVLREVVLPNAVSLPLLGAPEPVATLLQEAFVRCTLPAKG